jgi:hypothetical protein
MNHDSFKCLVEILTGGNAKDTQYYWLNVTSTNNFMVKKQFSIYLKNTCVLWIIFTGIFYLYCAILYFLFILKKVWQEVK